MRSTKVITRQIEEEGMDNFGNIRPEFFRDGIYLATTLQDLLFVRIVLRKYHMPLFSEEEDGKLPGARTHIYRQFTSFLSEKRVPYDPYCCYRKRHQNERYDPFCYRVMILELFLLRIRQLPVDCIRLLDGYLFASCRTEDSLDNELSCPKRSI